MIELPALGTAGAQMWSALLDVAEHIQSGWTLVGGQMVLLHALEHAQQPPRVSQDLDLVVDVRVRPAILPGVVRTLARLGFAPEISADEVAHRFVRGPVSVDVLAPDGVGRRTDLRTAGRATTVPVGGGTFALDRSRPVAVSWAGRDSHVPCPDLSGAILIKAVAAARDRRRGPERHLVDLAFLLSLVDDVDEVRRSLGARNRRRVGAVQVLHDRDHEAWGLLADPARRADAQIAFTAIAELASRTDR